MYMYTYVFIYTTMPCISGLPRCLGVKNLPANAEDLGSILALGRSPGEGNGSPL